MARTSLRELILRAKRGDVRAASVISDHCRFRLGLNYRETLELVRIAWPEVTEAEWAELMTAADYGDYGEHPYGMSSFRRSNPFRSKAQMRKFFAMEGRGELPPGTARRWYHETPHPERLPEYVNPIGGGEMPRKKTTRRKKVNPSPAVANPMTARMRARKRKNPRSNEPSDLTLIPAYGRDYKSKKAVVADWIANKDFIICDMRSRWDGKPINKQDAEAGGIRTVRIRFKRLTQVCILDLK